MGGYLELFFSSRKCYLPKMTAALIKPLSSDLVDAALDTLCTILSPRIDGFFTSIYLAFRNFFAPQMWGILSDALAKGDLHEAWSLAIFNPIPKSLGVLVVDGLRPIVLQNSTQVVCCGYRCPVRTLGCCHHTQEQNGFIKHKKKF